MQAVNRASLRTRTRILQCSVELFNCKGVQNVSLEGIAASLGISRSNVAYHFPRKEDLLRAILVVHEQRLREVLALTPRANHAQYGAQYMHNILRVLWDFRFFFNSLPHLLDSNKALGDQYFVFEAWIVDALDNGCQQMISHGDCRPMRAPNTTRLLAENSWSLWRSWLHVQHILSPAAARPESQAFYDCALHTWCLFEPYFSQEYAADLLMQFQQWLLVEPGSRSALPG